MKKIIKAIPVRIFTATVIWIIVSTALAVILLKDITGYKYDALTMSSGILVNALLVFMSIFSTIETVKEWIENYRNNEGN